jgi:hypothetical protein
MFIFFLLSILLCCSVQNPIDGYFELKENSQKTVGYLSGNSRGIDVYINHPNLSTNGWERAEIELEKEGGFWAFFDIETAMDTAHAAMRVQGKEARLPLGARRGEFDLIFEIESTSVDIKKIEELIVNETPTRKGNLKMQKDFWALRHHIIVEKKQVNPNSSIPTSEEKIVGYINWDTEQIEVFDASWYTPDPQNFTREVEGGDILLSFDIEPSFQGEQGLIRCNIVTREITIPSSSIPSSLDRRLYIKEAPLDLDLDLDLDLQKHKKDAQKQADKTELKWIEKQAPLLIQSLENTCTSWKNQNILDSWLGYRFETKKQPLGCQIQIIPDPPQHRRRFHGVVYHTGEVIPIKTSP